MMKRVIEKVLMNGNGANLEVCVRHFGLNLGLFL